MSTQIGPSIRIKGTLTAEEPVTIAGHAEGSITIAGHALTVAFEGRIDAETIADTIVIDGAANGRLTAAARFVARQTATITGHVAAPSVHVADGATINGRVETATRKPTAPRVDGAPAAVVSAA